MSEKLLPCPFCGGEARTFEYDGANQATCGGKHIDCAGTDVVAPVAMWNRRTPAPEGEAVAWQVRRPKAEAVFGRPQVFLTDEASDGDLKQWRLNGYEVTPLYASPVVPAPEGEACWPHSYETDAANQLVHCVDCGMSFASEESHVVPVGVSREEIAKALFERHWSAVSASPKWPGDDDGSYWLWLTDAILAALRPTDTGWRDIATAETTVLANTIRQHLLGIKPDDQAMVLEDDDWRLILKSLECQSAIDRPRQ